MLSGPFGVESWERLLVMETWWFVAYRSGADNHGLSYSGHLMRRDNSLEKTLMLGKIAGGEGGDRG